MDDFLSKPFKVAALKALLERWHAPVDRATLDGLREFIGTGDVPAYRDLLEVFLKDARTRLELVRAALAAGDAQALANEAHSLKGSAGTMGARHLQGLCRRLESLGKAGAAGEAGPWLEAAAAEFAALTAAFEAELAGLG
jgi:HPt (histidine-containing phosphotransfer) domain-containing protein